MVQRLVTIIYYKNTGKHYTTVSYISNKELDSDIHREVETLRDANSLPGLNTEERWIGYCTYCTIDLENGVRQLMDFTFQNGLRFK